MLSSVGRCTLAQRDPALVCRGLRFLFCAAGGQEWLPGQELFGVGGAERDVQEHTGVGCSGIKATEASARGSGLR